MLRIVIASGFAGLLLASTAAQAVPNNLLLNGSFESYNGTVFDGWTNVGSTGATPAQYATPHPTDGSTGPYGDSVQPDPFSFSSDPSGKQGAYFVADQVSSPGQSLRQSVTLVTGQTYEVGFDLYATLSGARNPNSFSLTGSIGGINIVTATDANMAPGMWQHYSATFVATQDVNVFDFTFLSGPSPAKDVIADLVYVGTPVTPVPEPASLALLGLGLVGLGVVRRARQS